MTHFTLHDIKNCMLYSLALTPETPMRGFQRMWASIWGQIQIHIGENQISSPYTFWFGHKRLGRYAFIDPPTSTQTQRRSLHQVAGGSSPDLDREVGCRKILCLATGFCTMPHKQENPLLAECKLSLIKSPLNIWPPESPDCHPLYYNVWSVIERETNKTWCDTENELKANITTSINKLN